jgi:hypothetical protein
MRPNAYGVGLLRSPTCAHSPRNAPRIGALTETRRRSGLDPSHYARVCDASGGRCRTRARGDLGAHQGGPGGPQGARKETGYAPDPAGAVERMGVARKAAGDAPAL